MWLTGLTLRNWMPFRGEHELQLQPKAYAVTARLDDDADRSNFLGKSALGEAILFGLTGYINPARKYDSADDWITRGEEAGSVYLTFSNGIIVERMRKRGKSTRLSVRLGDSVATQDEGQALLNGRVALTETDLLATCVCVQREAAFLARSTGAALSVVFGEWLRLGRLEAAEDSAYETAAERLRELDSLRSRLAVSEEGARAYGDLSDLQAKRAEVHARRENLRVQVDAKRRVVDQAREARAARAVIGEYDRLEAEGKALRKQYDAMDHKARKVSRDQLTGAAVEAHYKKGRALEAHEQARQLAKGEFDGKCPVTHGACPVSADILAHRARNQKNAKAREAEYLAADGVHIDKLKKSREADALVQEADRLAERLQTMRDQLARMSDRYESALATPEGDVALEEENLSKLQRDFALATEAFLLAERDLGYATKAAAACEDLKRQIAEAEGPVLLYSAAGNVMRITRRRVAEQALRQIERGANDDLATCGVPLSVQLRWEREGKKLSRACAECGRPFPDSARIKACECGAARGPQMVQQLDVVMSDRSGGAEDLAGLALQLAASRWLRGERASPWASAVLDEVTGQLDATHHRALMQHLPRMLSDAGLRQAFVISHSGAMAASLPGRIVIESDGTSSRARVAA